MPDTLPRSYWRWICLAAAIAGLLGSIGLTNVHLAGPQQSPGWLQRLCGAAPADGCQQVLRSPYARIGNLPAAAWGAGYFAVLSVWYLFVGRTDRRRRLWQMGVLLLTVVGCLSSAWFIWIMFARLSAWCPLCMFCHAMNALLLIGAMIIWLGAVAGGPAISPWPDRRIATAALALGVTVALLILRTAQIGVLAGGAGQFRDAYLAIVSDADYVRWRWQNSPLLSVSVDPNDPARGSLDAPHQVVVFSDFECPQCARLAEVLETLGHRLPGQLRIVFKHLPLDQTCNQRITPRQSIYPAACQAARAAEAARLMAGEDGFWRMHDTMMGNQNLVRQLAFNRLARMADLDPDQLVREMSNPAVAAAVARDIDHVPAITARGTIQPAAIAGTPLLILDGRRLEYWAVFHTAVGRTQLSISRTVALWRSLLGGLDTQPAP